MVYYMAGWVIFTSQKIVCSQQLLNGNLNLIDFLLFSITELCTKSWSRCYWSRAVIIWYLIPLFWPTSIALIFKTWFFGLIFPSIFEQRKTSHTADWHRPLILIDITMVGIVEFSQKTMFVFSSSKRLWFAIGGSFWVLK